MLQTPPNNKDKPLSFTDKSGKTTYFRNGWEMYQWCVRNNKSSVVKDSENAESNIKDATYGS